MGPISKPQRAIRNAHFIAVIKSKNDLCHAVVANFEYVHSKEKLVINFRIISSCFYALIT